MLLVYDVAVLARAAFLVVAAEREHLEVALATRHAIAIGPAPRVDQALRAFEIRPAPGWDAGRCLHEGGKPDLLGRIAAIVQIEQLERCPDVLDLNLSGLGASLPEVAKNLGRRHGSKQDEDAQHHEEFEER